MKKVREIQAIQYNGNNAMEVVEFVGDVIGIDWYENASLVKDHKDKIKVYEANEFEKDYSEAEDD